METTWIMRKKLDAEASYAIAKKLDESPLSDSISTWKVCKG